MELFDRDITTIRTNVFLLLDVSNSMTGAKIDELNSVTKKLLVAIEKQGIKDEIDVFVRIIKSGTKAEYVVGSEEKGVLISDAIKLWKDLEAGGDGNMSLAINECLKSMTMKYFLKREKKPTVILVSDGEFTDSCETRLAVDKLKVALSGNTGKEKVFRFAIGVGDYKKEELEYFSSRGIVYDVWGNTENQPHTFETYGADEFARYIASMAVSGFYIPPTPVPLSEYQDVATPTDLDDTIIIDINAKSDEEW